MGDFTILYALHFTSLCHASEGAQHHLQLSCSWVIHVYNIPLQEQACLKRFTVCQTWFTGSGSIKATLCVVNFVTVTFTTFSCHLCVHHCPKNIFISCFRDVVSFSCGVEEFGNVHMIGALECTSSLQIIQGCVDKPFCVMQASQTIEEKEPSVGN